MALLEIKNLTFTYPETDKPVLNKINLTVKQGDFLVLFGESGSGKTTLLKMFKRELTPHGDLSGERLYKGEQLDHISDREAASRIGYVMQNPDAQLITDKVWHELAFGLENIGTPTPIIRRRVGEISNFFGIHQLFRKDTSDLSGGEKQLVNLAAEMVMQPEVLILDEPTSQLDPIAASHFIQTVHMLNRELGTTIIMVEHRLEEVLPLANHVVLLEDGQLIINDRPEQIGQKLTEITANHRMMLALPTAQRIYYRLGYNDAGPLTIREGKQFLTDHYRASKLPLVATPPTQGERAIDVNGAWFRYEKNTVDILADVGLSVYQGEIFTILGGNGSGKTTLLKVMSGQERAYRGTIKINGKKIKSYKKTELYQHNLAVLPQDPQILFLKSTVREDYTEIAKVFKYSPSEIETEIKKITEKLSIAHLLDDHPFDLSGGEQQKVALGKILLLKPKILFLDEPTKGMDAFSKETLMSVIKDLQKEGLTIIMVTHDVEFAAAISDRCGLFFDRTILSVEPPITFFSANSFYTTAASRMSRHLFDKTITCEHVVDACLRQHDE